MPTRTPATAGSGQAGHELSGRVAAGEERAFAEFYSLWFASTLALARAISRRDESWCLDVVQDVMLTVANKLPKLASEVALRAWMIKTVCSHVTDRNRSEARRRRREQAAAGQAPVAVVEPWSDLSDEERLSWLSHAVSELPEQDRALVRARFGEASTVAHTAGLLGISSDAAHGRLRRALDRLRQRAAEYWYGT